MTLKNDTTTKLLNYFLAINLKEHSSGKIIATNVKAVSENTKNIKWSKEENLHITMFYFGPLNNEEVLVLKKHLPNILTATNILPSKKNLNFKIKDFTFFNSRHNSTGVLLIDDFDKILTKFNTSIKEEMLKLLPNSYDCTRQRPFQPHITLSHSKINANKKVARILQESFTQISQNLPDEIFTSDSIELMHLNPTAKLYETDESYNI